MISLVLKSLLDDAVEELTKEVEELVPGDFVVTVRVKCFKELSDLLLLILALVIGGDLTSYAVCSKVLIISKRSGLLLVDEAISVIICRE